MRRLVQLAPLPAVLFLLACPWDNGTEPAVKPGAPVIGTAVAGNTTAEISFTPPSNDGGAAVSSYTVTCSATGATTRTATGATSPITVTSLQNGSAYTCSVTATNSAGTSDASAGVSVTPTGPPGAPTIGVATPGNGSVSVAFSAPSSNGGSPITGYTATCAATGQTNATGTNTASPIAVSGLTNGTQYSCSVIATNARGNSNASASVNVTPATTPGAPTIGAATAGNGQAQIAFTAPASNGGSAITTYAAVCTAAAAAPSANGTSSPITVTGMTNGVTYACNVRAANIIGAGPASGDVNVTPVGPPAAPTIGAATPGNGEATIAFTAPVNNGGSAITGYTVTCTGSSATRTGTANASPITVTSMTNGVAYSCSVTATNGAGISGASGTVAVTPRTVPSAPTIGTATPGNGSASIAFTAGSNGGATITSYTVSCSVGGAGTPVTASGSSSPITVPGLTNDVTYLCSVTATNAAGIGAASGTVSVTPTTALGTSTLCGYSWNQVNNAITNASGTVYTSFVSYSCASGNRVMTMNQIPDHPASALTTGNPNKMGPQTSPSSVTFTLTPATTATVTTSAHVVGWAINGVKFEPSTAETCPTKSYCSPINGQAVNYGTTTWFVEALGQTLFSAGVDGNNAHVQPPTNGGAYHYHGMPHLYLTYLAKGQALTLVGFAVDGFPIYAKWGYATATDKNSAVIEMTSSYRLKPVIPIGRPDTSIVKYGTFTQDWEYSEGLGHLDQCNGRTGVTPEFPAGTYAYYITNTYPYIQRCHKGTVPP